jgi:hypothetical protein
MTYPEKSDPQKKKKKKKNRLEVTKGWGEGRTVNDKLVDSDFLQGDKINCFGIRWWWFHSSMNELNINELYILNG